MDEILAMIDWSLAHNLSQNTLRLDLFYSAKTPEEIAMLELALASFDLRYSPLPALSVRT
jgi:hypothetical protein